MFQLSQQLHLLFGLRIISANTGKFLTPWAISGYLRGPTERGCLVDEEGSWILPKGRAH